VRLRNLDPIAFIVWAFCISSGGIMVAIAIAVLSWAFCGAGACP
jgi:hypothetical protein